jgi:hypothetical protein
MICCIQQLTRLRELAAIVVESENPDMENDIISRLEQLSKPSSESKRISIHATTDLKHKINEVGTNVFITTNTKYNSSLYIHDTL